MVEVVAEIMVVVMALKLTARMLISSFFLGEFFFVNPRIWKPERFAWSHWIRNYFTTYSVNVDTLSIWGPK